MHDIIDLLRAIIQSFLLLLRGGVGTLKFYKIESRARNKGKQLTDIDISTLFNGD
jgi:hypothetical protein